MAPMATPQRSIILPAAATQFPTARLVWTLWIVVSIVGAVIGALIAWRIRVLFLQGPGFLGQALSYVATVANAIIASGAQWLILRRYRLDVYWWVPATVGASLISGIIVIPAVLRAFAPPAGGHISPSAAVLSSVLALAASGLIAGIAQSLVLRSSAGNIALVWIPATIIGNGLAGAATSVLSAQLFAAGLPSVLFLSLVAAAGALLVSVSQAPALLRILR